MTARTSPSSFTVRWREPIRWKLLTRALGRHDAHDAFLRGGNGTKPEVRSMYAR
jgi:hypothetical protein